MAAHEHHGRYGGTPARAAAAAVSPTGGAGAATAEPRLAVVAQQLAAVWGTSGGGAVHEALRWRRRRGHLRHEAGQSHQVRRR